MKKLSRGILIAVEGGEGAGKTTLCKSLVNRLRSNDYDAIYAREPGGIKSAEDIRSIVVNNDLDYLTQLLLFAAARRININEIITPALKDKKIIICDRYILSSLVYQGIVGNISLSYIQNLMRVIGAYNPDLQILLDVDPVIGYKRSHNIGREININDNKSLDFHRQINDGYRSLIDNTNYADYSLTLNVDLSTPTQILNRVYTNIVYFINNGKIKK